MPKTALFIILSEVGGAEIMTLQIARMLIENGWTLSFGIIREKPNTNLSKLESLLPVGCNRSYIFKRNQWQFLYDIHRCIVKAGVSLVFCSAIHINLRLLITACFHRVFFVVRNENYLSTVSPFKKKLISWLYNKADTIITQTEEMKDELVAVGVNGSRIRVLHNYIDKERVERLAKEFEAYPPPPNAGDTDVSRPIRFVSVGRVCRQKGFDLLIEAFAVVSKRNRSCELHIVGDVNYEGGEYYRLLKKRVQQLGMESKVIFHGFKPNPFPYLAQADVYVLSSRNEGLPNVLIEALALGRTCVAVRCIPVIDRMIQVGKTGFLAEIENPASLAEAMIQSIGFQFQGSSFQTADKNDYITLFNNLIAR